VKSPNLPFDFPFFVIVRHGHSSEARATAKDPSTVFVPSSALDLTEPRDTAGDAFP
jgi:acetyl/propionyl-CoA carboxylase alpha subunit